MNAMNGNIFTVRALAASVARETAVVGLGNCCDCKVDSRSPFLYLGNEVEMVPKPAWSQFGSC